MPKEILIVDDEPSIVVPIQFLMQQQGYNVLVAENGHDALDMIYKYEPDLVLLDIMLPGIDGFEVCRRLNSGTQTARIPILIISAKTQKEDINAGLKAGADDYLLKPTSPTEILNRVESLLSKKSSCQTLIDHPKKPLDMSSHGPSWVLTFYPPFKGYVVDKALRKVIWWMTFTLFFL